ncbi:YggT family protein [uncultured Clostridium sp.]|uniref:YggT family protein n=1 Tax=uncultured Clostridium sp. TaxID=59620 RepID=UPI0025FF9C6F|nr:YggT family protein [uncultured Clostridium sp.]
MIIIQAISSIFRIIELAIIVDCLASWIPQLRYNKFMDVVHSITYPILEPCRRLQYRFLSNSPIDFSPLIALLLLDVVRSILFRLLFGILF